MSTEARSRSEGTKCLVVPTMDRRRLSLIGALSGHVDGWIWLARTASQASGLAASSQVAKLLARRANYSE
jgi:hypothetical protein